MPGNIRKGFPIFITALVGIAVIGCNILNSGSKHAPIPVSATYEYWVTGGFAGISEHTVIDSTGLAQLIYRDNDGFHTITYRMTASEFDSFRIAFESADFFSLADNYPASQPVMDGFFYTITCTIDSVSKTVKTETNASVPDGLGNFLKVMHDTNSLIKSKGRRG